MANVKNVPIEQNEYILYVGNDEMGINEKYADIFITNYNIVYGIEEKAGLLKKEYKFYKISLDDILVINNMYKIWATDDDDAYNVKFLLNSYNGEVKISFSEEYGGADARDAFIVILTNILNHVHKH